MISTKIESRGDLEGPSSPQPRHQEMECLFFGRSEDGCQCAVAAKAVERIAPSSEHTGEEISLKRLGFLESADFRTPRILRIMVGQGVVPIALRASMTVRVVPFAELFPLPQSSFVSSIFSNLISSDEHGRALLLDPQRLLNFYHTHVDPFSPAKAPSL